MLTIAQGAMVAKKRGKRKEPGMTPEQVESRGLLSKADFDSITAYLGTTPVKVESRDDSFGAFLSFVRGEDAPQAAGPQRSEDRPLCGATPLLTGGESPQGTQTGESLVLDRNGKPVIRPGVRCIAGQKVGIDWVSCVFEPSSAWTYCIIGGLRVDDPEGNEDKKVAEFLKGVFGWILGFGSGEEKNRFKAYPNGLNSYKYAIGMPLGAGIIHVGHTSGTVLVTITGQGAFMAAPGWESRLHNFLRDVKGWLTRVDMAFDDYKGEIFPVRLMRERAKEGAFCRGGRPPKIELRGAWEQDDPTNSGLTLYVGSRMSGKYTRIYEKGKEQGEENSPWVRAEVELHNSCYQLTLDMLLHPTQWFVAFYPCFEAVQFSGNRQELEYRQRLAGATLEHSRKWIRHQAGGHLAALRQFYTDTELLDLLCRPEAIPEGFLRAEQAAISLQAPSVSLTDEPGWIEA